MIASAGVRVTCCSGAMCKSEVNKDEEGVVVPSIFREEDLCSEDPWLQGR